MKTFDVILTRRVRRVVILDMETEFAVEAETEEEARKHVQAILEDEDDDFDWDDVGDSEDIIDEQDLEGPQIWAIQDAGPVDQKEGS